jgi:hypothetical protein
MRHGTRWFAIVLLLTTSSMASGQETLDRPIKLEVGGTPGGGTWLVGGDDDTEVNFNLYTFSGFADWYLMQRVALEGEYVVGIGWGQDILFRNGRIPGQQVPYTNTLMGSLLVYPRGTSVRLPFYVAGGAGLMTLKSRKPTRKLGYNPDVNPSEGFTVTNIGAGVKIPRGASAPNWSFRFDYRLLLINSNSDAPAFFAKTKSRTGHHIQFGMLYTFRR